MGFDTHVDVGDRTVVEYRKQVGDLPRFLFTRDDLDIQLSTEPDAKPTNVVFKSTAKEVLQNLEEQGLGWDAGVAAYATVRDGSLSEALLRGQYLAEAYVSGVEVQDTVEARLAPQRSSSPTDDLSSLGAILASQWLDPTQENVLVFEDLIYDEPVEVSLTTIGNAIRAAEDAEQPPLPVARAVQTISVLCREARLVAWPMLMAVLLQHLPDDTPVRYVLTEGIDEFDMHDTRSTEDFVDQYWSETGLGIADYARNLGVLFGALADFETRLGPQYWFGRAATALTQLDQLNQDRGSSTSKARGDALENLMGALFQAEAPQLTVTEKNFSTREEEIDLVLRNNLPAPFWTSQNSPYIFVECKNWKSPVGVAELRTFESKIDDRKSVVRIGIFVSTAGYYKTFVERLKSIQTKGIGLVYAITLADIRGLVHRRERLSDWLLGDGAMRAFHAEGIPDES